MPLKLLRLLVLFLSNYLLCLVSGLLNHSLAPWQITLSLTGLAVVYPGLVLGHREGLTTVILAGLLHEATDGLYFGEQTLLFGLTYCFIYFWRNRIMRQETAVQVLIAILASLAIGALGTLLHLAQLPNPSVLWSRFAWETALSTLALVFLGPWFLALQARALDLLESPRFQRSGEER